MDYTDSLMVTGSDRFPLGYQVQVLLIDADSIWLNRLEKMLKKCDYKVTKCSSMQEVMGLLQERKYVFHIIMCDARMLDADSFNFVTHVAREMDVPVIMMSADKDTSNEIRGIQYGASHYLYKPIKMKDIQTIWHHVLRKQTEKGLDSHNKIQVTRGAAVEESDVSNTSSPSRKRKEVHGDTSTSSTKKSRVVWTPDLHRKFVEVVNKIGIDKGGPKKILNMMGVNGLTRENVASHLQKYRLSLSRANQKKNEVKAAPNIVVNCSDMSSRSHPVGLSSYHTMIDQSAVFRQPNIIVNESHVAPMPRVVETGNDINAMRMILDQSYGHSNSEAVQVQSQQEFKPNFVQVQSQQEFKPNFATGQGGFEIGNYLFPSCNIQVDSVSSGLPSRESDAPPSYGNAGLFYNNPTNSIVDNPFQYDFYLANHDNNVDLDSLSCETDQVHVDELLAVGWAGLGFKQNGDLDPGIFTS